MLVSLLAVAVFFVVASERASAEYEFSGAFPAYLAGSFGGTYNSLQSAGDAAKAHCDANIVFGGNPAGPCISWALSGSQWTFQAPAASTGGNYTFSWTTNCPAGYSVGTDGDGDACIQDAPACDESITDKVFLRPVFSGGNTGDICHESSACVMTAVSVTGVGSDDLVEYVGTSSSCSAEPQEPITEANETDQCISSGGDTWCTEPDLADKNCGHLNGEYLCLDDVPEGNCTFFGNGDMACSSSAAAPPAPDDGVTPGVPAVPDTTIDNNGSTTNIYNSTTVSSSGGSTSGTNQSSEPLEPIEFDLDFDEIIETAPSEDSYNSDIDQQVTTMGGELDDLVTDLGDLSQFDTSSTSLGDGLASALALSSCSDYVASMGSMSFSITCAQTADMRNIFAWVLRVAFVLGLFQMLTSRPGGK